MTEQLYYLGVKAFIQNQNKKVLVLKSRKGGYWDLPGGRTQPGEDVIQTLLREIKEETGLNNLTNIKPDTMFLTPHQIKSMGLILWYHTCDLEKETPIQLSDEHDEFVWVEREKAHEILGL